MKHPTQEDLYLLETGDFQNNEEVDAACVRRLLILSRDFGKEGQVAAELIKIAGNLLELAI